MGRYEREKGKRGELEWAAVCREAGFVNARRGGQAKYQRGSEVADCLGLPFIHQEVKNVERLNVRKAMEQSARDAKDEGRGFLPMVAHKANKKEWLVTMRGVDWLRILKAALRKSK